MGSLFGYLCNDFALVESAFHQVAGALNVSSPDTGFGWGLGYFQNKQVLLQKRLAQPGSLDFGETVKGIKAHCIMGWSGERIPSLRSDAGPPYRCRRWLLGHEGPLTDFDRYRDSLLDTLSERTRNNIHGRHPSELLLHYYADQIRQARPQRDLSEDIEGLVDTLGQSLIAARTIARASQSEVPPVQNVVISDGRVLIATCMGQPVRYRTIEGIFDDPVRRREPLFAGHRPRKVDHPTFRATFVASGCDRGQEDWEVVHEPPVLVFDSQAQVTLYPIPEQ